MKIISSRKNFNVFLAYEESVKPDEKEKASVQTMQKATVTGRPTCPMKAWEAAKLSQQASYSTYSMSALHTSPLPSLPPLEKTAQFFFLFPAQFFTYKHNKGEFSLKKMNPHWVDVNVLSKDLYSCI